MRAVSIVSLALLAIAIAGLSSTLAVDPCDKFTTCSTCFNSTAGLSCGWCSENNVCMQGDVYGPLGGKCKSWRSSCVGASIPITHPCKGNALTLTSLRRLMGIGGTNANLTKVDLDWNYEDRTCMPFTGCSDWKTSLKYPSLRTKVRVTLRIVNDALWLNFIAHTCPDGFTCLNPEHQLLDYGPRFGDKYFAYGIGAKIDINSKQITQTVDGITAYEMCKDRVCRYPSFIDSKRWIVTLTDTCFRLANDIGTDPEDRTQLDFMEISGLITYP